VTEIEGRRYIHRRGEDPTRGAAYAALGDRGAETVVVPHARQERHGTTRMTVHYGPETTLAASMYGRTRRAPLLLEHGTRSNGDHREGRSVWRAYDWNGAKKGVARIVTQVREHGPLPGGRPTRQGHDKVVAHDAPHIAYVAYPGGSASVPDFIQGSPYDAPGMHRVDRHQTRTAGGTYDQLLKPARR
jgi:hypothetical protein